MDTSERSVDRVLQRRNVDLCQIHVHLVLSTTPTYLPPVHNRESQRGCQDAVDARFGGTGVDKCPKAHYPRNWRRLLRGFVGRIEADIHQQGRAEDD